MVDNSFKDFFDGLEDILASEAPPVEPLDPLEFEPPSGRVLTGCGGTIEFDTSHNCVPMGADDLLRYAAEE